MNKYDIVPSGQLMDTIEAASKEDAMDRFVLSMDLDMSAYFKAIPHEENDELIVIRQNDNGVVFKSNKLPSIFNVYVLKKRCFKNGTCRWKIGIENAYNDSRYFIIDSVIGSKEDAISTLKNLLR